eukprot:TRINITY_DN10883_c0_g1_i1.p1 TRINITY_DN10883_c0_g1~~TRINITY_DN10883_c0_g1_i1.p1  ORF type:complete len:403 (+),score=127.88 TRINITY_DN10883_c0_g1_i1:254-1462(+)
MDPTHIPKVNVEALRQITERTLAGVEVVAEVEVETIIEEEEEEVKESCTPPQSNASCCVPREGFEQEVLIAELTVERNALLSRLRAEDVTTDAAEIQRLMDLQVFQHILHNVMVCTTNDDVGALLEPGHPGMEELTKYLGELARANFDTHQQISMHYKKVQEEFAKQIDQAVQELGSGTPIPSPREGRASFRLDFPSPRDLAVFRSPSVIQTPRDATPVATPRTKELDKDEFDPMEQMSRAYDMQGKLLMRELQQHIATQVGMRRVVNENKQLCDRVQALEREIMDRDEKLLENRAKLDEASNTIADLKIEVEAGQALATLKNEHLEAKRQWKRRESLLLEEIHSMQASLESDITALLSHSSLSLSPPPKGGSIWAPQQTYRKPSLASGLENLRSSLQKRTF